MTAVSSCSYCMSKFILLCFALVKTSLYVTLQSIPDLKAVECEMDVFFSCARLVVTTRFEKQNSLSALGIYPPLCSLLKGEAFMTSSNGGNIKHRIAAI